MSHRREPACSQATTTQTPGSTIVFVIWVDDTPRFVQCTAECGIPSSTVTYAWMASWDQHWTWAGLNMHLKTPFGTEGSCQKAKWVRSKGTTSLCVGWHEPQSTSSFQLQQMWPTQVLPYPIFQETLATQIFLCKVKDLVLFHCWQQSQISILNTPMSQISQWTSNSPPMAEPCYLCLEFRVHQPGCLIRHKLESMCHEL